MKNISIKTFLGVLIILVFTTSYTSPQKRRPFCGFNLKDGYYYEEQEHSYITREGQLGDRSGIPDVVEKIQTTLGMKEPKIYVYISKDEDNCFATIGEGGRRMLVADHLFLVNTNRNSGTNWAAISIIAHEIGHHIAGFSRRPTQLDAELDADYWSGYILQKLGAGKDASTKCIMRYGTENDTSSHPNKYSRAETIKKGWDDALNGYYDKERCESCN